MGIWTVGLYLLALGGHGLRKWLFLAYGIGPDVSPLPLAPYIGIFAIPALVVGALLVVGVFVLWGAQSFRHAEARLEERASLGPGEGVATRGRSTVNLHRWSNPKMNAQFVYKRGELLTVALMVAALMAGLFIIAMGVAELLDWLALHHGIGRGPLPPDLWGGVLFLALGLLLAVGGSLWGIRVLGKPDDHLLEEGEE